MNKKYLINKLSELNKKTNNQIFEKIESLVNKSFGKYDYIFFKNASIDKADVFYVDISEIKEMLNPSDIKPEKIQNVLLELKWR